MSLLRTLADLWLADLALFSQVVMRRPLYRYQLAPAQAIVDSVLHRRGLEFAVMFPRQAGKNETQAQVEAYLLNVFQHLKDAQLVKAQPTFKPQGQNAMRRLEQALRNDWNQDLWKRGPAHMLRLGEASCAFFSAEPKASVVGATASILLQADEAQDIRPEEWERKFVPMTVSTNATIVYWGTAWTAHTLLARTIRHLRALEARDGRRRVFIAGYDDVAAENPAYARAVARQVARLGRQNPLVKSQYFNEEIDAEGGLFPPERRARMQGQHAPLSGPRPLDGLPGQWQPYAFLIDVGGEAQVGTQLTLKFMEDESHSLSTRSNYSGRRDATALTIVEVDLATVADPLLAAPTYRAVFRRQWVGVGSAQLGIDVGHLIDAWQPAYVVCDVSGLGQGLGSFLKQKLADRPRVFRGVTFTAARKSQIGWGFLALCDSGRWQEWQAGSDDAPPVDWQPLFWMQLACTQFDIRPGPERLLAWGVPDGTRDPRDPEAYLHDDLVISAALSSELDGLPWHAPTGPGVILHGADPLAELSRGY
jgi:hypothetical protein